jgi:Mg-chelatase subunit ChlD
LLLGAAADGRLGLGGGSGDGDGHGSGGGQGGGSGSGLSPADQAADTALAALYEAGRGGAGPRDRGPRSAGLGASAPTVARWLGDIRTYFPSSVVQVMQRDAIDRLNLRQLLLEPELLESIEPDVHLVGTLLSLTKVMPETTRATARQVVARVVAEVEQRIAQRTRAAVSGALNRAARSRRPKLRDIDWNRTIGANLARYLPEYRTVVPERLVGYGRRQQVVARDVVLAIDQSGSMASSVVYAAVFGAVLASIRALKTSLVVFDTAVVDLTSQLSDPVDVLFGTQLGGGTDINKAIAYSQTLITRPRDSIFVLISDLIEGGIREQMLSRIAALTSAGVQVVVLLALSDDGAPVFDQQNAAALADLGVPAFACTPDAFPELLAVAIDGGDVAAWAHRNDLARR